MAPDVYSIADRHHGCTKGSGQTIFVRGGHYTERQLLWAIRELHLRNNPKPRVVEAWKEPEPPLEAPTAPPCPTYGHDHTLNKTGAFERLVEAVVGTRDHVWNQFLSFFSK